MHVQALWAAKTLRTGQQKVAGNIGLGALDKKARQVCFAFTGRAVGDRSWVRLNMDFFALITQILKHPAWKELQPHKKPFVDPSFVCKDFPTHRTCL